MNIKLFWKIIDNARDEAGGWEDMYDTLLKNISDLSVEDIVIWYQIFDEYHQLSAKNKLWAAAYIINGGCSDDGFEYFRGWLIAQGQDVYLNALSNPDTLANMDSCEDEVEFEDMLSVAYDAYFNKLNIKNRDYDLFDKDKQTFELLDETKQEIKSAIQYDKDIDVEWSEDALKNLLPALCEAFDF